MQMKVFIGSSSSKSSMGLATAISVELQQLASDVFPVLWREVFNTSEFHMESLSKVASEVDFAIFVLSPDDELLMTSGSQSNQAFSASESKQPPVKLRGPRDNVVFELGLFIGSLGRDRCFVLMPDDHDKGPFTADMEKSPIKYRVFTDYLGINREAYISAYANKGQRVDAVRPACYRLIEVMRKRQCREYNQFKALFGECREAVIIYPNIVAGSFQDYQGFPPLVSLETRVHRISSESDYETRWWYRERYPNNEVRDIACRKQTEYLGNTSGAVSQPCGSTDTTGDVPTQGVSAGKKINDIRLDLEKSIAPNKQEELAHFADQRAAAAISELVARNLVRVATTMDGQEQDVLQATNKLTFTIGLASGLAIQVFQIVCRETLGGVFLVDNRAPKFCFNGEPYPKEPPSGPIIEDPYAYAIIIRCFLRHGNRKVPHFVIGGCNANGTAAAGVYLRNHWQDLLQLYEIHGMDLDQQSMALVLKFSGEKYETSKPFVMQLCFFGTSGPMFFHNPCECPADFISLDRLTYEPPKQP